MVFVLLCKIQGADLSEPITGVEDRTAQVVRDFMRNLLSVAHNKRSMSEEYTVEDWLTCPNCFDSDIQVRSYNYREGVELECMTCGERSHKDGKELEPEINL